MARTVCWKPHGHDWRLHVGARKDWCDETSSLGVGAETATAIRHRDRGVTCAAITDELHMAHNPLQINTHWTDV